MPADVATVTLLLQHAREADPSALRRLIAMLYGQFRDRARQRLYGERAGHSLGATDLTNETLVRLLQSAEILQARNAHQLFRAYARAMRQALVDHARRRCAEKRGGHRQREELNEFTLDVRRRTGGDPQALQEALDRLARELPREATVLDMKYFGGFALDEIAAALGVSLSTVQRDARFALNWLRARLRQENDDVPGRPASSEGIVRCD